MSPTILVTGATDGLGRAVAGRLASEGAAVVVHGRDPDRAAEVAAEIGARPPARGGAAGPDRS